MINKRSFFIFLYITLLAPDLVEASRNKTVRRVHHVTPASSLADGPVTIFIHGTVFPMLTPFTYGVEYPAGLISLKDCTDVNPLTRIGHVLATVAPDQFNLDSFYLYCWPGELRFDQRKKATEKLLSALIKHKGPVTIIAHSHGCNVALYLAELAGADDSLSFSIDTLILFACPVQLATAHLIYSSLFKRVFSFYSAADMVQTLDPQGLYPETIKKSKKKKRPLFSQRTFHDAPNLIQARVLINKQGPDHMSFIKRPFLNKLPALLELLEASALEKNKRSFIVNIPQGNNQPYIIDSMKLAYKTGPKKSAIIA